MNRHAGIRLGTRLAIVGLITTLLTVPARPLTGQTFDRSGVTDRSITRSELQELATLFRGYAESPSYSESVRREAAADLQRIERRLSEGDFRAGDIIRLEVRGQTELTDTFMVATDGAVLLPQVGSISLRGVLASELERHLYTAIARVIREPQVTVSPLVRLAVLGEVNTPGFYLVPANAPITEVLMTAGGPTPLADVAILRIERAGEMLMEADVEAQSKTVAQLNLQQDDRIVLPAEPPPLHQRLQIVTVVVPILALLTTTYLAFFRN